MTNSTSVALVAQSTPHSLVACSLDQLAEMANEESRLVEAHLKEALAHARRFGEIVLVARDKMERGEFKEWALANINASWDQVLAMQRVAFYFDQLPNGGEGMAMYEAIGSLNGFPAVGSAAADLIRADGPHMKILAERWVADGLGSDEIASALGIPPAVVEKWFDPKAWEQRRLAAYAEKARRAQKRAEHEKMLTKAKEAIEGQRLARASSSASSKAYGRIRQLLADLTAAKAEAEADRRREIEESHPDDRRYYDMSPNYLAREIEDALEGARYVESHILDVLRMERENAEFRNRHVGD